MAPVPGSEVLYSDTLPEALTVIEERKSTMNASSADFTTRRLSPQILIIVTALIATIVVGIAVGVGVGVGLTNQKSSNGSSSTVTRNVSRR